MPIPVQNIWSNDREGKGQGKWVVGRLDKWMIGVVMGMVKSSVADFNNSWQFVKLVVPIRALGFIPDMIRSRSNINCGHAHFNP